MLKYYSLALVSGKLLLLHKSESIVHRICSPHQLVRVSDEYTFKRVLVVEHNAHEKIRDICFEKKK